MNRVTAANGLLRIVALCASLGLAACHSGGDDTANNNGGSGSSSGGSSSSGSSSGGSSSGGSSGTTATYLPYVSGTAMFDDSVFALDPAAPTAPTTIHSGSTEVKPDSLYFGTLNPATGILTDVHPRAVVFARGDTGRLYKASMLKAGTPTPVQVSNESQAGQICSPFDLFYFGYLQTDFADVNNSQYVYSLPGTDNTCDTVDDIWRMVRLGMSATDTPISASRPIAATTSSTTGAIDNWLVRQGAVLRRCDANFANCGGILVGGVSEVEYLDSLRLDRHLLRVNFDLRIFNGTTGTMSAPLFTVTSLTTRWASDGNFVYFVQATGTGASQVSSIYRINTDGLSAATFVTSETGVLVFNLIPVGTNLIYSTYSANISTTGSAIKSVVAAGGTGVALYSSATTNVNIWTLEGNTIFFYEFGTSPSTGSMDTSGANRVIVPNSMWGGFMGGTTIDTTKGSSGFSSASMLRIDGITGTSAANGTLRVIDIASGAMRSLGVIPAGIRGMYCYGRNAQIVCDATVTETQVPLVTSNDIFYANSGVDNSLVRVTNTNGRFESFL